MSRRYSYASTREKPMASTYPIHWFALSDGTTVGGGSEGQRDHRPLAIATQEHPLDGGDGRLWRGSLKGFSRSIDMVPFTLILIRGIPGSGKTTIAERDFPDHTHLEADMYFVGDDGEYRFDPKKLKDAHQWCQEETKKALARGENVVVSNTFVKQWEMEPYLEMVDRADVLIIECSDYYGSIHNVPETTIQKMIDNWEEAPQGYRVCGV